MNPQIIDTDRYKDAAKTLKGDVVGGWRPGGGGVASTGPGTPGRKLGEPASSTSEEKAAIARNTAALGLTPTRIDNIGGAIVAISGSVAVAVIVLALAVRFAGWVL